jgi:hypothetical protein
MDTGFREPESKVEVESFDSDIFSSLRYAAGSAYGVRAPANLSEEVGVFISDDLVPASLHREVCRRPFMAKFYLFIVP